jgi:hypothetical protein
MNKGYGCQPLFWLGHALCAEEQARGLSAKHHACRLSAKRLSVSRLCIRKAACTVNGEKDTAAVPRSGAVLADGVNAGLTPNTSVKSASNAQRQLVTRGVWVVARHQTRRAFQSGQLPYMHPQHAFLQRICCKQVCCSALITCFSFEAVELGLCRFRIDRAPVNA